MIWHQTMARTGMMRIITATYIKRHYNVSISLYFKNLIKNKKE